MLMCVQGSIWVQRFDLEVRTFLFWIPHLAASALVKFIKFPSWNVDIQQPLHFCE